MPRVKGTAHQESINEMSNKSRAFIQYQMMRNGLNTEQLAANIGVTGRTIQNWLNDPGAIRLKDLWEMAYCMKCTEFAGSLAGGAQPGDILCQIREVARR